MATLSVKTISDDKDTQAYLAAAGTMEKDVQKIVSDLHRNLSVVLSRGKADQKLMKADSVHQSFQAYISLSNDPIDVSIIDFKSNYDRNQLMDKIGRNI